MLEIKKDERIDTDGKNVFMLFIPYSVYEPELVNVHSYLRSELVDFQETVDFLIAHGIFNVYIIPYTLDDETHARAVRAHKPEIRRVQNEVMHKVFDAILKCYHERGLQAMIRGRIMGGFKTITRTFLEATMFDEPSKIKFDGRKVNPLFVEGMKEEVQPRSDRVLFSCVSETGIDLHSDTGNVFDEFMKDVMAYSFANNPSLLNIKML